MDDFVRTALAVHLPSVLRWSGSLARLLRPYPIGLAGKGTGSATTDALTLADLGVQDLILNALRDTDPIFRHCRVEAEESVGDLAAFARESPLTIGIDPIDGTRKYRDQDGHGYSVMMHLRSVDAVLYSLVAIPHQGPHGAWVEVSGDQVRTGLDDPMRPAGDVIRSLPVAEKGAPSRTIYVNGFQSLNDQAVAAVDSIGLRALPSEKIAGCILEAIARGELAGALVHSPNVYDFPILLHLIQAFGGRAVFVQDGRAVDFRDTWVDARAHMRRLPGIVACCVDREMLGDLCALARDWNPDRYHGGATLL